MKKSMRVAVTGAAGQISYSLLFRIAAGDMLGRDQPVSLRLLEIAPAMKAVDGVIMELEDCAFPLLSGIEASDDPRIAFDGVDVAILVGAKPRGPGMQRKDLLRDNGPIFTAQGKALNDVAARNVKVCVVGNPANTNCLIAMSNAPDLPKSSFTSMMRLDHNRAMSQLATKLRVPVTSIDKTIVWGNHSNTQYPDITHAETGGKKIAGLINDPIWVEQSFIPVVQERGKAIIDARGKSSAASAASAAVDHVRDWHLGTAPGQWVSMGVPSDGSYGAPEGLIFGFPTTCQNGQWSIVQGLDIDAFSRTHIDATARELHEEREAVADLLG